MPAWLSLLSTGDLANEAMAAGMETRRKEVMGEAMGTAQVRRRKAVAGAGVAAPMAFTGKQRSSQRLL